MDVHSAVVVVVIIPVVVGVEMATIVVAHRLVRIAAVHNATTFKEDKGTHISKLILGLFLLVLVEVSVNLIIGPGVRGMRSLIDRISRIKADSADRLDKVDKVVTIMVDWMGIVVCMGTTIQEDNVEVVEGS